MMTLEEKTTDFSDFRKYLSTISFIPEEEWDWLALWIQEKIYEPKSSLFEIGQVDSSLHLIIKGIVRYYYITDEGQERNHTFAAEQSLVACLPSFVEQKPFSFTIESIERTKTLVIPSSAINEMNTRNECWLRLRLRLMEHAALRRQKREADFLVSSAETRYLNFCSQFPELVNRIPQDHIASYLGITPVALSRIRKRIIS